MNKEKEWNVGKVNGIDEGGPYHTVTDRI